jgi:hypothetical protein
MIGAPAVSYANGRYDVFVIGADGSTYHRSATPNGWSVWKRISTERLAGGLSVVRDPAGNFHVFGTDWLGGLWQITGNDARWSTQSLGGVVLGTPAVTYANGRFDVFAEGVNQTLCQKSYVNGRWTAWTQIVNRPFRAELKATVDVTGTFHLFALDAADTVWTLSGHSGSWTARNLQHKAPFLAGVTYRPGRYDMFSVDSLGLVAQTTYPEAG